MRDKAREPSSSEGQESWPNLISPPPASTPAEAPFFETPADPPLDFAETGAPECNWGELTSDAIADGFDQGTHAADPSGDGLGPEDRVGLANVIEQGDLHALCEFIADQIA